jgi:hypothetical protein
VKVHEEVGRINWLEFKTVFRTHHVAEDVMKLEKKEF